MPDGQMRSPMTPPLVAAESAAAALRPSGPDRRPMLVSPAAYLLRNAELLAQNALLLSALDRQRAKSADLRGILSQIDVATLSVCPELKLRRFTAAAGQLLDIGTAQVGSALSFAGQPDVDRALIRRIRQVLRRGTAEEQELTMQSGQKLFCLLLPIRALEAGPSTVDGVILLFSRANAGPDETPPLGPADQSLDVRDAGGDGGLAAGYPDIGCGLTRRQHQVLAHVLAGHPSKNIAADLGISRRTVENHRAAIMARTGATSLPALARIAVGADVGGDCKPALPRRVSA